jgi:hypothetical protein
MNGIEAMSAVTHRRGILRVISQLQQSGDVLIAVMDAGTGLDPASMNLRHGLAGRRGHRRAVLISAGYRSIIRSFRGRAGGFRK